MNRKTLWVALAITALVAIVWPLIPVPSAEARLAAIPTSSPDFQSQPLELSIADKTFLGNAQAVQRIISARRCGNFVLTVIDGSRNRHAVHDPAYCFSGGGWSVLTRKSVKLASGDAIWVSLGKDGQTAEALWFFDDGKKQFTSPVEYWFKSSCRRATIGRSGDEPVLVTLRSLPENTIHWDRVRQILLPALGFH